VRAWAGIVVFMASFGEVGYVTLVSEMLVDAKDTGGVSYL
jgi:hypothetical protein